MKALTVLVLSLCTAALAWTATSNNVTMTDAEIARARAKEKPVLSDFELLVNGDFETGELTPWTTTAWMVTTKYPHGGTYCASDIGNYYIEQEFAPTPGSEIESVTLWMRQPESAISWCGVYYDDGSDDHIIAYPDTSWTLIDLTSIVNPAKNVVRLRVWGYSGGGPGPDSSFLDDASVQVAGTGVLEPIRTAASRVPGLTVSPNPVAGDFVRLDYLLPRPASARVSLLDVTGRSVLRQEIAAEQGGSGILDLRGLKAGVYIVRLEAAGALVAVRLVRHR